MVWPGSSSSTSCVVGRGHVSPLTTSGTRQSKLVRDIWVSMPHLALAQPRRSAGRQHRRRRQRRHLVVEREHVSPWSNLDTWQCNPFRSVWCSPVYYQQSCRDTISWRISCGGAHRWQVLPPRDLAYIGRRAGLGRRRAPGAVRGLARGGTVVIRCRWLPLPAIASGFTP